MFYYVCDCKFEYTKNHLSKEICYENSMIFRCQSIGSSSYRLKKLKVERSFFDEFEIFQSLFRGFNVYKINFVF